MGPNFSLGEERGEGGNKKKWVPNSFEVYIKIIKRKFRKWLHA
jgi:hypothetical protein